jgi:cell wall-associated NlpC family hydrolase
MRKLITAAVASAAVLGGAAASLPAAGASASSRHETPGAALDLRAVHYAEGQLGVPYVFGGESPGRAFDCSGLMQYSYRKAGKYIPRTVIEQWRRAGTHVPIRHLRRGDLLFFYSRPSHVAMYIGHDEMIEAPHTGLRVRVTHVPWSLFHGAVQVNKR